MRDMEKAHGEPRGSMGDAVSQPAGKVSVQAPNGSVRFFPRKGAKAMVDRMNKDLHHARATIC